jgi:hypothetical protein
LFIFPKTVFTIEIYSDEYHRGSQKKLEAIIPAAEVNHSSGLTKETKFHEEEPFSNLDSLPVGKFEYKTFSLSFLLYFSISIF